MRRILQFLLLLSVQLAMAQNTMQRYEYWMDSDYDGRKVVAGTQSELSLTLDVPGLSPGIHYFNFRGQAENGQWGGLARYLVFLSDNTDGNRGVARYEYWMDSDYDHRAVAQGAFSGGSLSQDVSSLSPGIHYFNFRAQTVTGQWGALSRYLVFLSDAAAEASKATEYEYWMDNDFDGRTVSQGSPANSPLTVDVSSLSPGIHYFNFRARGNSGQWGALSRYLVFLSDNTGSADGMTAYEYWMDNDYDHRTLSSGTGLDGAQTLDVSSLSPGVHYFNIRAKGASGQWGALSRYLVFLHDQRYSSTKLSSIEYWIDTDTEHRQTQAVGDEQTVVITVALDEDLALGEHTFNFHGQTTAGEWCLLSSYAFTTSPLPQVPTPVITREGNLVSITVEQDSTSLSNGTTPSIYYTLDGTKPSRQSTLYEGPIEVTRNGLLQAVGVEYAHDNSEVASMDINWFDVDAPTFSQTGNMLTMQCSTPGATITYKIGGGEAQTYSEPIRLADQTPITAMAQLDGYHPTDEVSYTPRAVRFEKPVVSYDGRYLSLNSNDAVRFYYTLDGTSPADGLDVSASALEYNGRLTIDSLCTLRAVVVNDTMNVSEVNVYLVDYYYDGEKAGVRKGGVLADAFVWARETGYSTDLLQRLAVEGPLDEQNDLALLKSMPVLAHLDLSQATVTSNRLPISAFEGTQLVSFVSPSALNSAGGRLFADCPQLAAVIWNADVALNSNTFEGVGNPNLLVYVNSEQLRPSGVTNVVVGGVADAIILANATSGNNDFYVPQAFTATEISYTRNFSQETEIGKTMGWESIALPFTVTAIRHASGREIAPFGVEVGGHNFWLAELTSTGLAPATTIEANRPYLISMPNNTKVYDDEFNQNGDVTFSAQNAEVPVTEPVSASGSGVILVPTMARVDKQADVYALNVGDERDGHAKGSAFLPDYRTVRPFEAYTLHPAGARPYISLASLHGNVTGIHDMPGIDESLNGMVRVYSLSGLLVTEGEWQEVKKHLAKGVYIVNGMKVIVE